MDNPGNAPNLGGADPAGNNMLILQVLLARLQAKHHARNHTQGMQTTA
jgi:hypothetical protein